MPRRSLPPSLPESFTTAEALVAGATPDQLRRRSLSRPHHGVRSLRAAVDDVDRARQALPLLRPDEAFCHRTALALWGLPEVGGTDLRVHVGGTASRQRKRPALTSHRYVLLRPVVHLGLPVVDPVEAWVQAAPVLSIEDLVVLGDALAGGWSPHRMARLVAVRLLEEAVLAAEARPGVRRLRRAVELVRERVDSPQETRLRLLVTGGGLPEPEVNVRRWTTDGQFLGRPDLSWPGARVALEYEGDHHRTDVRTFRSDILRRERFADEGWHLMRVTADDLTPPGSRALLARLHRRLLPE